MLIIIIVKIIVKVLFICISDNDTGIDFMIPILSDTFDMVYRPSSCHMVIMFHCDLMEQCDFTMEYQDGVIVHHSAGISHPITRMRKNSY